MILKPLNNKKGITLVELIVVLAIIGIVIGGGFSMLFFGQKTFDGGTMKSSLQHHSRFATDQIINQLRYATDVKILYSPPDPALLDLGYNYIYLSSDNKSIIQGINNGGTPITKSIVEGSSANYEFEVLFKKLSKDTLEVNVKTEDTVKNKNFIVDSELLILNVPLGTLGEIDDTGGGSGDPVAIRYKTANTFVTEHLPLILTVSTNTSTQLVVDINKVVTFTLLTNGFVTVPSFTSDAYNNNSKISMTISGNNNNKTFSFSITEINGITTSYEATYRNSGNWSIVQL